MAQIVGACSLFSNKWSSGKFSVVASANPLILEKTRQKTPVIQKKSYIGSLVVRKKSALDLTDIRAQVCDAVAEVIGNAIGISLLSKDRDPDTEDVKISEEASVEGWLVYGSMFANEDVRLSVRFTVDDDFGEPGALFVKNMHPNEFYLKSVEIMPTDGTSSSIIPFICQSWVYNSSNYKSGARVFFANQLCLPDDTPPGLWNIRQKELESLRGDGKGERKEWERVYDYDTYNDLGNPDKSKSLARPILGGSTEYPYPRRCRTGRPSMKTDKSAESLTSQKYYIPADEKFTTTKNSDFLADTVKAALQFVLPVLERILTSDATFDSFAEVRNLYVEGFDLDNQLKNVNKGGVFEGPLTFLNALFSLDDGSFFQYPLPQVVQADDKAWMSDEEFAREMLSGVHPVAIELLKEFPPRSNLDPGKYGPQLSAIKEEHISRHLEGKTVEQAIQEKKMFTLDYHDAYMPYLEKINALPNIHFYASRTLLYLQADGTLKPVAIELSLPPSSNSTPQRVFLPPASGDENWSWILAKAHVTANDAGYHQLVSHFLRTHASLEPFIIATHRHLSALHPLHRFLLPHYKATLSINSMARQSLINVNGIIERTFSPGPYSMTLSSAVYKNWRFDEQALPADLLKRGMATPDASSKHGVKLVIEDYPFAADALEIWSCIEKWTGEYVDIFYKDDGQVASDAELQAWWEEIITVGHADKKDGWVKLNNRKNLREVLTTVIWLASGHHAAVNFGQYAYAGYMPNHPTCTHKAVPEEGSKEYKEMSKNPEAFFLSAMSHKIEATLVMTTIEILSTHATDEEYIGERTTKNFSDREDVLAAFARFGKSLKEVENIIDSRNKDPKLKNRMGPVEVPYTLLYPSSKSGITGRGIPNSISI